MVGRELERDQHRRRQGGERGNRGRAQERDRDGEGRREQWTLRDIVPMVLDHFGVS